jgi:hypothetical protein
VRRIFAGFDACLGGRAAGRAGGTAPDSHLDPGVKPELRQHPLRTA